ncbi:MAG: LytR/AlgR family response regulator transcription factor [Bacteroidota bacterium]
MALRLSQPYPFYYDSMERVLKIALVLAVLVPVLLLLLEPFNVNYSELKYPYAVVALIFGVVDSAAFVILITMLRRGFPGFMNETQWTLLKEWGTWALVLLGIGMVNFGLREFLYANPENISLGYLLEEISHSYIFGILLAVLLTLANFVILFMSHSNQALSWNDLINLHRESGDSDHTGPLVITADSESETMELPMESLLYARVDGNYVEYHIGAESGSTKRLLQRNTLKNVEQQLADFPHLLRVHRSFLVNCDHIESVSGNAQGYKLTLDGIDVQIPVSRSYLSDFDAVMNT